MAFRNYLISDIILDVDSDFKDEALDFVVKRMCKKAKIAKYKPIIDEILEREDNVSSFVGQGVAIVKATATIENDFAIMVARNCEGISYDAARKAKVNILVVVLINKNVSEEKVIELTADIATFFKDITINAAVKSEETDTISELFREKKRRRRRRKKDNKRAAFIVCRCSCP
jgi:mannitol/fructose-specific phosphotransferase system IIA component (Ntr-type)